MILKFEQGELFDITYLSESKNEVTQRQIIPTSVPKTVMKAIDVSELSVGEQLEMKALYKEYAAYYANYMDNAFNFETWCEHSKGKTISPKWRAFRLDNIKTRL